MDLIWEDLSPDKDSVFFTRDAYEKYSLAPNIIDLWAIAQSSAVKVDVKAKCSNGDTKAEHPPASEDATKSTDNRITKEEGAGWDTCDSDSSSADSVQGGKRDRKQPKVKKKNVEDKQISAYPEPRIPFPRMSTLSSKEQKTYLGVLTSKKNIKPPQKLMVKVNNEVAEFMRYLHNVSRMCAEDYNYISQGAVRYSEELFMGCLEYIRTLPQLYQIHEMTSLTGGTFIPSLMLTFEKQLLITGNVDLTDCFLVSADAQLASDYENVSSENPPAKKAKDKHAAISSDSNAEKLSARYRPHVCLTQDALVRILDNCGPEFSEAWELPVWVKTNPEKDGQRKTVYVDSPLLKTEMTNRERSHIFHQESLKLSIRKRGKKHASCLLTELPASAKRLPLECSQRSLVSFESTGFDSEVDLTNLETFGETATLQNSPRKLRSKKQPSTPVQNEMTTRSRSGKRTTKLSQALDSEEATKEVPEDVSSSQTGSENTDNNETTQPVSNDPQTLLSPTGPRANRPKHNSTQETSISSGDSEDERLVIDDSLCPNKQPSTQSEPKTGPGSQAHPETPSPKITRGARKASRRVKVPEDQLGQILRMQTAMLNPAKDPAKCSAIPPEAPSAPAVGSPGHAHPTSLVKPCVSSYLESHQNWDGETCITAHAEPTSVVNPATTQQKKLLQEDLQGCAEDEQDYEAPEDCNLLYKLYSLQDLLLMVRSSVALTYAKMVGSSNKQHHVPVHILPKLEYQLCYGVECLTWSEACQLWAESLLHSSTVSHIVHINALTSKVALQRELREDWLQNITCNFKPSKSLNILHHLLKKISGLEEGRYLVNHKAGEPFVTILKAADDRKVSRGAFNLQQIHSSGPRTPASGLVPWVPVDPAVVLPFHKKHGRVPCTFPPEDPQEPAKGRPTQTHNHGATMSGQPQANCKAGGKKKKNKGQRTRRRQKWLQRKMQNSNQNPNK